MTEHYVIECLCGKKLTSPTLEFTCDCGQKIRGEWPCGTTRKDGAKDLWATNR